MLNLIQDLPRHPELDSGSQQIAGQARNDGGQARNDRGQARNDGVGPAGGLKSSP